MMHATARLSQLALRMPHPPLAVVEPDDVTWDTFTQQHTYGHLLQSSSWGTLKAQFGWRCQRVAVVDDRGLIAGAQVLFRHRLGLSVAYVPRGPLFSGLDDADQLLLAALDRLARRARAVFLRLEPNVLETDQAAEAVHRQLLGHHFHPADPFQPRSTIHLQLDAAPDRLMASMSKGHRADIRRAAREGVMVRVASEARDFDAFYKIIEATSARAKFGIHSRAYYAAVYKAFAAHHAASLLLAERAGMSLATALIFAWAGTGLYLYSGSTEAGLKSGAQHAIQWQALQWARAQGCTIYDFWGIPDAFGCAAAATDAVEREQLEIAAQSAPLYGVYRFKKGFGGHVRRYLPAYDRIFVPVLYALWRRSAA